MRPVCSPSSSTDSSSSAESPSTPPSSTAETSSARRERIVSSRAIDCTVCASASATSRASPFSEIDASLIAVLAEQRAELVLETAGLDRAVDAALLRSVRLPPPATRAQVLALLRRARAGRAADGGVALVVERVVGKVVLAHVLPHLFLRPLGERVQLHDCAVVVVDLHLADVAARRPLVAAKTGNPGVEAG